MAQHSTMITANPHGLFWYQKFCGFPVLIVPKALSDPSSGFQLMWSIYESLMVEVWRPAWNFEIWVAFKLSLHLRICIQVVAEHGAQSRMSFQRVMFSQKSCLLLVLIASVWRAETCGPRLILQASLQWLIEHDVQVRLSHCLSGSLYWPCVQTVSFIYISGWSFCGSSGIPHLFGFVALIMVFNSNIHWSLALWCRSSWGLGWVCVESMVES